MLVSEEQQAEPLLLKFGLDNARTSQSHKTKQEIGGMELILPRSTLSSLKSPKNCYVWGGASIKAKRKQLIFKVRFQVSLAQINNLNGTNM